MTEIDAKELSFQELNELLRRARGQVRVRGLCGQRFLAAGSSGSDITLEGVPGNALGAYLNGSRITVRCNAQDAVGDTMNDGAIVIHGSVGDAVGYAMRGGSIFIRDDAGYRAGIHMKAYETKIPHLVIGGVAGSFLGEYQAGGVIMVLGLRARGRNIVKNFPGTGMHGGKMYLRGDLAGIRFPRQVKLRPAGPEDQGEIRALVEEYCRLFGEDPTSILSSPFTVVEPDSKNPYKQLYVTN